MLHRFCLQIMISAILFVLTAASAYTLSRKTEHIPIFLNGNSIRLKERGRQETVVAAVVVNEKLDQCLAGS